LPDRASLRFQALLMQPRRQLQKANIVSSNERRAKNFRATSESSSQLLGVIYGRGQMHTVLLGWHHIPHRFKKRCEDASYSKRTSCEILTSASAGVIRDRRVFN
jgi:hypothetical protein